MSELNDILDHLDTMQRALDAMRLRIVALTALADPVRGGLVPPKLLPAKAAAVLVGKNEFTLKRWCRDHGIGHKVGGQWYVDVDLLQSFVQNGRVNTLHS